MIRTECCQKPKKICKKQKHNMNQKHQKIEGNSITTKMTLSIIDDILIEISNIDLIIPIPFLV